MSARLGQLAKFPINNIIQDWDPESGFQTEILWTQCKSKSTPASEFHFQQQVLRVSSWLYQGWVLDPPSLSSLATVFQPRCNCSSRLTGTQLVFNCFWLRTWKLLQKEFCSCLHLFETWLSSSFVFIFCPQTWLEPGGDSNWTSRKSRRWKLDSVLCLIYTTTFLPLFHIGSTGLAIRASFFLNKTNLESYRWKCYQMQFEINPNHVTFSRWLSFKTFWWIQISLLCQSENSGSWLWWSWRHELLLGRRSSS